MKINLNNISKSFDFEIFNNINYTFKDNTTYGVLGLNGTGKTTLINMILGIDEDYSGNIEIDECNDQDIFFIPSENILPGYLSGREYVTYMCDIKKRKFNNELFSSLVELFDLQESVDKNIESYSFGMVKKNQFICAIVLSPKLLIMDELTSGIDIESVKLIEIILKKTNNLKIIVSHNLNFVENICDNALIISDCDVKQVDKDNLENELFDNENFKKKVESIEIGS